MAALADATVMVAGQKTVVGAKRTPERPRVGEGECEYRGLQLYSQAVLVSATNPKAVLFFSALFPQFLSPTEAVLPQFAILTSTFMVMSFAGLVTYGVLGSRLRRWMATRAEATWPN
jgi:threonine/homoserine/homoserine lactone efflux protein